MFQKIKAWFSGFGDIIDWISRIGMSITIASSVGIAIKQWSKDIDTLTIILLVGVLFGLLLVSLSFILRWRKKRSIKSIPDLLLKMDEKMKCLIGTATIDQQKGQVFINDAGELWDVDIQKIQFHFANKNITELRTMVKDWESKPSPFPQPTPQPFAVISNFLQSLRGLMFTDEVGTDAIKDTEYIKMEKRLETLKKRLPDSRSIRNLDRYLIWWNGSNHWQLFKHYGQDPFVTLITPAKAKAYLPQFDYLLQIAVNEYLGYVKDSIFGKEKSDREWKPIETN